MELHSAPAIYEKLISYDEEKLIQVRMVVNTFRGTEYLQIRKYYMDFDGENWLPTSEGIAIPLSFEASKELFDGLVEILSLAEAKGILETHFKETLDNLYQK